MALPGIDVADEIDRLNHGHGVSLGNNRWQINGRVYVDKGNGSTYPESGDGIVSPSRLELIGLRYLIGSGGDMAFLHERTRFDPNFDRSILERVMDLYAIWKEARDST